MGGSIGRIFTPEGSIMGIDWASGNPGEQKRRAATANAPAEAAAAAAAESARLQQTEADRLAKETAGKPLSRSIGRARGAGNTVFTSPLGYGGAASLARKQLLGQ
jgi:hypothetical protein